MQFMKSRIRGLVDLLPLGVDLRLWLERRRLGISYRGIFESYSEAVSCSRLSKNEYDLVNREKARHEERERLSLDRPIPDYDYPLLFWISRLMQANTSIVDLGGSVGHFYYRSQQYFEHPERIEWRIAELPEAVELGRRFAAERAAAELSFFESDQPPPWKHADILLTAGTIQYMELSIEDLLARFESKPEHILINSLPMHPEHDFWTLQDLGTCEVPYHVFSESSWVKGLEEQGYRLVDRWSQPRAIEIPFHRNLRVQAYRGFYFGRCASV